ncbi:hypothetical protein AN1V17_21210 [Vallitalea sediminicola]
MIRKENKKYQKTILIFIVLLCSLLISGCAKKQMGNLKNNELSNTKITTAISDEEKKTPNKNATESAENQEKDLIDKDTTSKETDTDIPLEKKDISKFNTCKPNDSDIIQPNNNGNDKDKNSIDKQYTILENNTPWHYKYYSPNKKNFIKQEIFKFYDIENYYDIKLYLNDDIIIDNSKITFNVAMISHIVEWIDDNTVLVNGIYVYNVTTGEKEYINFEDLINKENKTFINYFCLNNDKNKVAYITDGIPQRILLYNLDSKKLKVIRTIDEKYYYEGNISEVFWDNEDNIYINGFQFIIDDNEIIPSSYSSDFIFKYTITDDIITLYKQDSKICQYISNLNQFVILDYGKQFTHLIIDIKNNTIVFKFRCIINDNICTKQMAYETDDNILAFYDNERNYIRLYSFKSNELISAIDLSPLISKGLLIDYLDFNNKHLNFYAYKDIEKINSGNIYSIQY